MGNIEDSIEERIFTTAFEEARKDPEYVALLDETIYYGQRIMKLLGPENSLFLKYQRSACLAKGIRLKGVYQLGVADGGSVPNKMPNKI